MCDEDWDEEITTGVSSSASPLNKMQSLGINGSSSNASSKYFDDDYKENRNDQNRGFRSNRGYDSGGRGRGYDSGGGGRGRGRGFNVGR